MEFFEGTVREQVGKIIERSLDVAFIVDGAAAYQSDVERCWTTRLFVALPDRHPLAGSKVIEWGIFENHFIFGLEAIGSRFVGIASDRLPKLDGPRRTTLRKRP
jgi:hypothetical protein